VKDNAKVNEFLFRRVDLEDAVAAHVLAAQRAREIGFRRMIVSATTPFLPQDVHELRADAPSVVRRRVPNYEVEYQRRNWKMFPSIDRVYVNDQARRELGWHPLYDFAHVIGRVRSGDGPLSPLAQIIGAKGYHAERFAEGPYPVRES
jgi:nucleoside-diphosphate-sugar epimerase